MSITPKVVKIKIIFSLIEKKLIFFLVFLQACNGLINKLIIATTNKTKYTVVKVVLKQNLPIVSIVNNISDVKNNELLIINLIFYFIFRSSWIKERQLSFNK